MIRWVTVGEQRHVLLWWRRDADGKTCAVTGCGQLIWPSRRDARIPDPRVCVPCDCVHVDGVPVGRNTPATAAISTMLVNITEALHDEIEFGAQEKR